MNIHVFEGRDENITEANDLLNGSDRRWSEQINKKTDVLVLYVFEEFKLPIGTLAEDGGAKRLHNLFDCDRGAGQLILCRAGNGIDGRQKKGVERARKENIPDKTKCAFAKRQGHQKMRRIRRDETDPFRRAEGQHNG